MRNNKMGRMVKGKMILMVILIVLTFMIVGCSLQVKENVQQCKERCYASLLEELNSSSSSVGRIVAVGEEKNNCLKVCDSK